MSIGRIGISPFIRDQQNINLDELGTPFTVQTLDDTPTPIYTLVLQPNTTYLISTKSVASAQSNDYAGIKRSVTARLDGLGQAVIDTPSTEYDSQQNTLLNAFFSVLADSVILNVKGLAATPINWRSLVSVVQVANP